MLENSIFNFFLVSTLSAFIKKILIFTFGLLNTCTALFLYLNCSEAANNIVVPYLKIVESDEERDIIEEEDALKDDGNDASRNRINTLKVFVKYLLFREEMIPKEHGVLEIKPDLNENKVRTCLLLTRLLKPYIPAKADYSYAGHQLPYVVLANDLLRCPDYSQFSGKICPMSTIGLKSFRLDTPSLFKFFCEHGSDRLTIFGYDNKTLKGSLEYINY